mmetsp:Transcript_52307/g.138685  ORF Transcript_52307/g.138685 Transcript_52307/m.138685 type:complete len:262 (-) Transcript_52307:962-1747(-)
MLQLPPGGPIPADGRLGQVDVPAIHDQGRSGGLLGDGPPCDGGQRGRSVRGPGLHGVRDVADHRRTTGGLRTARPSQRRRWLPPRHTGNRRRVPRGHKVPVHLRRSDQAPQERRLLKLSGVGRERCGPHELRPHHHGVAPVAPKQGCQGQHLAQGPVSLVDFLPDHPPDAAVRDNQPSRAEAWGQNGRQPHPPHRCVLMLSRNLGRSPRREPNVVEGRSDDPVAYPGHHRHTADQQRDCGDKPWSPQFARHSRQCHHGNKG